MSVVIPFAKAVETGEAGESLLFHAESAALRVYMLIGAAAEKAITAVQSLCEGWDSDSLPDGYYVDRYDKRY